MTGHTQLFIDGQEVALPASFAVTVKRDNPFFTKNGAYTYDIALQLSNPTNARLYGFLQRVNRADKVDPKRPAILIADGRVYCRGTEVITSWTDDEVHIQLVSGNSELNYFIGDSLLLSWLNFGEVSDDEVSQYVAEVQAAHNPVYPAFDFCLPAVYDETARKMANVWYVQEATDLPSLLFQPVSLHRFSSYADADDRAAADQNVFLSEYTAQLKPQPYLCAFIRRLVSALGYTIDVNQLETSTFKYVFLVNAFDERRYAHMFPGWRVGDFLTAIERLCNVVFLVNNDSRHVSILQAAQLYQNPVIRPLQNVVDAYEAENVDEPEPDYSSANLSYVLPDTPFYRKARLSQEARRNTRTVSYDDLASLNRAMASAPVATRYFRRDRSTRRLYIRRRPTDFAALADAAFFFNLAEYVSLPLTHDYLDSSPQTAERTILHHDNYSAEAVELHPDIAEVDFLNDLEREDNIGTLEIEIVPAPIGVRPAYWIDFRAQTDESAWRLLAASVISLPDASAETAQAAATTDTADNSFETALEQAAETAADNRCQLYAAICNGLHPYVRAWFPTAFIDDYQASTQGAFNIPISVGYVPQSLQHAVPELPIEGSLLLERLDAEVFGGAYRVDTSRQLVFETFDPNMADPRAVYVIHNRRFVCREIEETITPLGRRPRWKMTCHPIEISDTASQSRWILDKGVWDDGGLWLDDGRWNDGAG